MKRVFILRQHCFTSFWALSTRRLKLANTIWKDSNFLLIITHFDGECRSLDTWQDLFGPLPMEMQIDTAFNLWHSQSTWTRLTYWQRFLPWYKLIMNFNRPELFFAAFVGLWIGVSLSVARLGGWATLATFYCFSGSFNGDCWRFQSGELRWKIGYNNGLTVGANPTGLYLSVFFLFRLGHPDLFVPWADISVTP